MFLHFIISLGHLMLFQLYLNNINLNNIINNINLNSIIINLNNIIINMSIVKVLRLRGAQPLMRSEPALRNHAIAYRARICGSKKS